MPVFDSLHRPLRNLRLSVTDRCNLRCQYCMPAEGVPKLSHDDILGFEDLYRIASQVVALGFQKIRVTGGEPLVRKGVVAFLQDLAAIPGLRELGVTTNGLMLSELSRDLRRAGVQRLNVSLDSLKPEVFAMITRGGDLKRALDGIAAAEAADFPPVKLNMVVMRGINDAELLDFAALTLETARTVRFIEYMPTNMAPAWNSMYVSGAEILARIKTRYSLAPLNDEPMAGPARNYRIDGAAGTMGIITPVSNHFCRTCNRLRITAAGRAKACLFGDNGVDLKPYLSRSDGDLRDILREIVQNKPAGHQLLNPASLRHSFAMAQVGG